MPSAPILAMPPDLIVIAASNGENLKLAERCVHAASQRQAKAELIDLTELSLPLYSPRVQATGAGSDLSSLRDRLHSAPRWMICAPEYNGSIPPVLSNAIAWLSVLDDDFRSLFNGRPIAIGTHSGGGGMEVLISMRIQFTHLGAEVIGRQLLSNFSKPAKDESIDDVVSRLLQRQPLALS
jgi:chromate reductase